MVGAELSETAVKNIFNRKDGEKIPHEVVEKDNVKIYSATDGKNLKVYVGNFFAEGINPNNLGTFDCIWDAHGIISLPASEHQQYASKLASFLKPKGKILFSVVDCDVSKLKEGHAPALVTYSQLQEFYPECEVRLLESKTFPVPKGHHDAFEGVENVKNPVILVSF